MWAILLPRWLRPPILRQRHDDWPWVLRYIPRSLNAWVSERKPIRLLGNERDENLDIPEPGEWVLVLSGDWSYNCCWWMIAALTYLPFGWWCLPLALMPFYFAYTTHSGWHSRLGSRYDFNDWYYVFPTFTFKRLF